MKDFIKKLEKLDKQLNLMGKAGKEFHIALVRKNDHVLGRRYKDSYRLPGVERGLFDPRYTLANELNNGYGIVSNPKNLKKYIETDWIPEEDHYVKLIFWELFKYRVKNLMFTPPTKLGEIPKDEVYGKLDSIRKLTRQGG